MAALEARAPADSRVTMFQTIHPQHCDSNGALDFGELLRWADLATCAAAEAHTRANCVTVAVSDLALEAGVTPENGDVLEILATLVLAGNTSLDVALLVTVERRNSCTRVAACSAQFTYVTMRLPDGSRPRCPPLALHSNEEKHMAHLAKERKAIISKQRAISASMGQDVNVPGKAPLPKLGLGDLPDFVDSVPMSRTTIDMTELVLPPHTNHMNNTFGGQVMAWMHKAATIAARRHVVHSCGARGQSSSLRTLAVEAVEFPAPSRASDHLLFEATVARVFAPNHLAVTVRVRKRVISEGGGNTTINTGVFHLDALDTQAGGVAAVRPDTDEETAIFQEMGLRRELTAARALLLSFRGGALPWVEALAAEAGRTTVQAVLRLLPSSTDDGGGAIAWQRMEVAGARPGLQVFEAFNLWGQDQTGTKFVLSCADVPASSAFDFLMDPGRRRDFDELCVEYERESSLGEEAELMRLVLRVPLEAARGCQPGLARFLAACVPEPTREFSLLRAWRREGSGEGVIASRSVAHPGGPGLEKRQVVQPSGWVVTAAGAGCVLTYIVTFENDNLRQLLGAVDNVAPLARIHCRSMERLQALLVAGVAK